MWTPRRVRPIDTCRSVHLTERGPPVTRRSHGTQAQHSGDHDTLVAEQRR